MYRYDKDEIKQNLTIEQIMDLVAELGGEPILQNNFFTAKTICHGGESHKLYYYENTHLFRCYTECDETFDIFELIVKIKNNQNERKIVSVQTQEGNIITERDWNLYDAVIYVAGYFGISGQIEDFFELQGQLQDWNILTEYEKNNQALLEQQQIVELEIFNDNILKNFPRPHIIHWEKEGINYNILLNRGIAYDPLNEGIIIPHFDMYNNLIGIRERTLIKEEEQYGKYKPAILNGKMYNHPLSFNLYNLNNSKDNIKIIKKAIIFEGEKSPLLYASYFGEENDISVACCGSSLITYQVKLLLSLGVEEIVIAFDKQFKEIGDQEWKRWKDKLIGIHNKYGAYVQISYLFDKQSLLGYKDSPIDKGPDIFIKLFKERIIL